MDERYELDEQTIIWMAVIVFLLLVFFFHSLVAPAKAMKTEINQMIAEQYGISYTSDTELDHRIDFYEYHPVTSDAKSGCYYVVDGVEYPGGNQEINDMISKYVFEFS